MSPTIDEPRRPLLLRLLLIVLRVSWTVFVVAVPLVGVWIASALAAANNGPIWLAVVAGALAFPVLPLGWEALSALLRRRLRRSRQARSISAQRSRGRGRDDDAARTLGLWDRVVLRTLAINVLFVGGLLATRPSLIFEAVATRGDWMLDGVEAPWAEQARGVLHRSAEGLAWLHEQTHRNQYEDLVDADFSAPAPPPPSISAGSDEAVGGGEGPDEDEDEVEVAFEAMADAVAANRWSQWPQEPQPHPLVLTMPAEAEASIPSVAAYIGEREPDPWRRTKALHDYVATRVAYDHAALDAGPPFPPQDAESTLARRQAVCAGYANLFAALVQASGGQAVVVVGDARGSVDDDLRGAGHAWNAVEIEGRWLLVDTTWDAGAKIDGAFRFDYSTDYLFTPPEVIGLTHFPDDPGWQLRAQPLERGEFLRQPVLRPGFFADGFDLLAPRRAQIHAGETVEVVLDNRRDMFVLANLQLTGGGVSECTVEAGRTTRVRCRLLAPGRYELRMFANDEAFGSYHYIGALSVDRS